MVVEQMVTAQRHSLEHIKHAPRASCATPHGSTRMLEQEGERVVAWMGQHASCTIRWHQNNNNSTITIINKPVCENIYIYMYVSRQTQMGIGHSTPTNAGRPVLNRIRCSQQQRGNHTTEPHSEQP